MRMRIINNDNSNYYQIRGVTCTYLEEILYGDSLAHVDQV